MKDIIKPIVVLASICLVVTALLAYVNSVTSPIITEAEAKAASEARTEVLPAASKFEKMENVKLPEGVTEVFKGDKDSGFVFMLTTKGYGGDIKMICGIDKDGKIVAVKTLTHSETNGFGSRVVGNDSGYHQKYTGVTEESYKSVDSVTGATISSKAYKKAIASAFEAYKIVKEVK